MAKPTNRARMGRNAPGNYQYDKEDAIATAKAEHGPDIDIRHRSRRYGPDPD